MSLSMTKIPYTTPRVVRVRLTHEQAVLSACSVTATTVSTNDGLRCRPSSPSCKKQASGGGRDDTNTS